MTDKELLQAAARATGHTWKTIPEREASGLIALWLVDQDGRVVHTAWNPLEDDGPALRLAVKLGISFRDDYCHPYGERVMRVGCTFGNTLYGDSEPCGDDPYAAARRAIVRAAAEIGNAIAPSNR